MSKKKYRQFKRGGTTIEELSGVDKPAQEGARALIMKRDDSAGEAIPAPEPAVIEKALLTDGVDGHSHIIDDSTDWGHTTWIDEHNHPWVRTGGTVVIGEANGHAHSIATAGDGSSTGAPVEKTKRTPSAGSPPARSDEPNSGEDAMSKSQEAARIETLEAALAKSQAIAKMTDAQKAHHATLDESEQAVFVAKSASERDDVIEKADPVVYTTDDGLAIRKSDGSVAHSLAKKSDENAKLAKAHAATAEAAVFAKRADDELGNLPGKTSARAALLKAVDSLGDEDKEEISRILKSINDGAAGLFKSVGHSGVTAAGAGNSSGEHALNKLRDDYAKEHSVNKSLAMAEVMKTEAGQVAYAEYTGPEGN